MQISPSIIEGCINQERLAQRKLYEECYSYMMAVCYRYAKSEDEALEFMNMGFLKVLTKLEKKPVDVPFKFWIRKILINSMIDEFRKSKKYKESIVLGRSEGENEYEGEKYSLNEAESRLNVDDIYRLIKILPPMSRKVFNLYVVDGYNHREIGEMLGITDGTSKWHLATAKKKLRELIIQFDVKLKAV